MWVEVTDELSTATAAEDTAAADETGTTTAEDTGAATADETGAGADDASIVLEAAIIAEEVGKITIEEAWTSVVVISSAVVETGRREEGISARLMVTIEVGFSVLEVAGRAAPTSNSTTT